MERKNKMAKMNRKSGNNTAEKKTTSAYEPVPMTNIPRTAGSSPSSSHQPSGSHHSPGSQQSSGGNQASAGTGTLEKPAREGRTHNHPALSHKQIEDRAKEIWRRKGCPAGQDEQNWLEAEAQLKKEMGVK
jgi:hypothetical protein